MTVLEPGPGMGFFTLELARLAGPAGAVVAVDIQPRMLEGLRRRAAQAGLASRIDARLAPSGSLGVDDLAGKVDFVLAFAMVHEMPDQALFFREASAVLKPGGRLLLSEPRSMVGGDGFPRELAFAQTAGFRVEGSPAILGNLSALLRKG
jgi:SAM-dependent methyltransferase